MFFHIMTANNKSVISGKLKLMRPHTSCSEVHNTQCFVVYMNSVTIHDADAFADWSSKFLKNSFKYQDEDNGQLWFSLDAFRNGYDFLISESRH